MGFCSCCFCFFQVHLLADRCLPMTSVCIPRHRNSELISTARTVCPYNSFLTQLNLLHHTHDMCCLTISFFRNKISSKPDNHRVPVNLILSLYFSRYFHEMNNMSFELWWVFQILVFYKHDIVTSQKTSNHIKYMRLVTSKMWIYIS